MEIQPTGWCCGRGSEDIYMESRNESQVSPDTLPSLAMSYADRMLEVTVMLAGKNEDTRTSALITGQWSVWDTCFCPKSTFLWRVMIQWPWSPMDGPFRRGSRTNWGSHWREGVFPRIFAGCRSGWPIQHKNDSRFEPTSHAQGAGNESLSVLQAAIAWLKWPCSKAFESHPVPIQVVDPSCRKAFQTENQSSFKCLLTANAKSEGMARGSHSRTQAIFSDGVFILGCLMKSERLRSWTDSQPQLNNTCLLTGFC